MFEDSSMKNEGESGEDEAGVNKGKYGQHTLGDLLKMIAMYTTCSGWKQRKVKHMKIKWHGKEETAISKREKCEDVRGKERRQRLGLGQPLF